MVEVVEVTCALSAAITELESVPIGDTNILNVGARDEE
jgi:hypothetical protein